MNLALFLGWPSKHRFVILLFAILFTNPTWAQNVSPLNLGEFLIYVYNSSNNLNISADASGAVGGSRCSWYPITHAYDHRSNNGTSTSLTLQHMNRSGCPGDTGSSFFAYGAYTVTIEGNYIVVDFRDADYEDGTGNYGEDYSNGDLHVYYDHLTGYFYKDSLKTRIAGSIAIWDDGRKSSGPRIPVTVTNSFGGGQVTADGGSQNIPYEPKWNADGSNHTIAAISPQTYNGLIYQYSSWSDAGSQSHNVSASLSNFGAIWTANFSVQKPVQVTGVAAGGTIGQPVHISWTIHPNPDVEYYIYRKVKYNGVMQDPVLVTTLSHSTTSYDDPDYQVIGYSSYLLYYDVRAHHVPSNTFADPFWTCGGYGKFTPKLAPAGAASNQVMAYDLRVHPNPFNPSTTIDYQLPTAGDVRLVIYDVVGRQVADLMHGVQEAGQYSVIWNPGSSASGVYYVRLTVVEGIGKQEFTKTTKLLMIK